MTDTSTTSFAGRIRKRKFATAEWGEQDFAIWTIEIMDSYGASNTERFHTLEFERKSKHRILLSSRHVQYEGKRKGSQGGKTMTRKEVLKKYYEMEMNNVFHYSQNYLMNSAKKGYEKEWEDATIRAEALMEMMDEMEA